MSMRTAVAGALLLATFVARTGAAQDDPYERRRFTGALGLGVSSAGVSCAPECSLERQSGPALMARVGGHISPQFTLGLETTLYRADVKGMKPAGRWALSWLGLSAAWYPNPDEDFFLKIALGVASLHVDVPFPGVGAIELTSSDFGATIGIGRDFHVTERFAITAFGDILFTPRSSAVANGSNSGAKISADMVHAGLAITIP
jgi:hypothetical protein